MMEEMIPLIRIQVEEVRRGGGGVGGRTSDADEEAEGEGSGGDGGGAGRRGELSAATSRDDDDDSSNNASSESKSPGQRLLSKLSPFSGRADDMRPGSRSSSSSRKSSAERDGGRESVSGSKRGRRWRNVQAVMAYYHALRKIKRTKSNQRWMKLRTTVQLSSAIQKKPPLKREDSFLKRFSTRQIPETQETVEDTGSEGATGEQPTSHRRRRRAVRAPRTVVNPDENFYFYWLWIITGCVLYNLWTLIVRQSFPELQIMCHYAWVACDGLSDAVFALDLLVQLRTGYLEQGLMVYDSRKLARHYLTSRAFLLDLFALTPLDLVQLRIGTNPIVRFPRFLKVYRAVSCYYMVESRTVYPNFWRVINLIHILLILAHWFGCFYYLLSEAEGFQGDWVYPHRPGDYATLTRKYLGSLYWSTLTLTTIGDLPTPETNADALGTDGPKFLPRRGLKSRLLQFKSNKGYVFTIVSYLIGVFIFATIVGQVGNVITNRNANRLEFERLLDGAKTYMRHHKVPGGMKRRVLRWYDYSWSRGRIQGGGDINTALGLLPDKLKTELALHVNLSVLKKVTIFQECQPEFLHDLVLKMKAYIFTPGDSICRKGEVAREMFIIADGILEVISETGRVLTTMKAGDFFGEIGILNLDGLNKRTADVRSVGYSELFSLSREDVLAAMKDYPEAQEILQTLGRKRLQEARNCSRHHRAKGDASPDRLGDGSAPKRIVHKIRSDVKGIRNALRSRSRATRRSAAGGDSLDLHGITSAGGEVGGKGVLRRMPRVESDEYHGNSTEDAVPTAVVAATAGSSKEEKVISPIGAGLPLLARLKLLKERQDRDEKAAKQRASASAVVSSGGAGAVGVVGGSAGAAAASEPEVIGAGLPLLQRLLLLKAKEERERNQLSLTSAHQPSSSETVSPSSLKSPLSPTVKTLSPIRKSSESSSPGGGGGGKLHSPTARSSRKNSSGSSDGAPRPKVSFKDKILQVQSDGTAVSQPLCRDRVPPLSAATSPADPATSNLISIPHTVVNKIKSPAKAMGTTFRDKLKLLQGAPTPKELSETPAAEKCKLPVIADRTPADSVATPKDRKEETLIKKPWNKLKKAAILGESKSQTMSSVESVSENKIEDDKPTKETAFPPPTDVSTAELVNVDNNNFKVENNNVLTPVERPIISLTGPLEPVQETTGDMLLTSPDKEGRKSNDSGNDSETLTPRDSKNYISIDDLSPEYGGLPFVKKLKILNERQKLAELERAIKTRSSSLDCTSSCEDLLGDTLTRSHSEGSTMGRRKCLRAHQATAAEELSGRESNETLERRTLKSILKKLSGDITPTDSPQRPASDLRRLIRAPTLEGYAVRHSKFAKSVTFNRHTLPSPPTSTAAPPPPDSDALDSTSPPSTASCSPPPESDVRAESSDALRVDDTSPVSEAKVVATSPPLPPETPFDFRPELDLQPHLDPMYEFSTKGIAALRPEEIRVPSEKPKLTLISAVTNQRKLLRGSVEEQEYFGEVLLGIKQVIQGHLHDVQGKFQERFNSLENEVRKRDEIISQLQSRIQELERCGLAGLSPLAAPPPPPPPPPHPLRSSSGSDDYSAGELVFMVCSNPGRLGVFKEERGWPGYLKTENQEVLVCDFAGKDTTSKPQQERGDSLDTVFATSPPTPAEPSAAAEHELSDERLERLTAGLDLDAMSFAELQSLAESISRSRSRRGDSGDSGDAGAGAGARRERLQFRLDTDADSTYSRRRAAKLRQRKSWEEHSDQESMELYELTRPLSPHTMAEDRSLLSPEETSLRAGAGGAGRRSLHPFHLFGSHLDSTKSKIKKTLSVDTGMHQTGRKEPKFSGECEHRKFSLGSFFGYHRDRAPAPAGAAGAGAGALGGGRGVGRGGERRPRANNGTDVVLDISSDHSWSDSASSSSSSDSDSVPRTPVFEEFMESRPHRASHAPLASALPAGGGGAGRGSESGGADWEILMLAEELEKRERERARQHHYDRILKDLEEESDTPPTPLRDDSVDAEEASPPPVPPRAARGAPGLAPADDCRQRAGSVGKLGLGGGGGGGGGGILSTAPPGSGVRASRGGGVILRAASLDRECSSPPAAASGAGEVRATSAASPGSPARRSGSLEARRRL